MEKKYYDGTKLLSLKDINGEKPEIYISTSNRSAGKTTFFSRWFVKRFLEHDEKFILLYRYNYELYDVANKFFSEIQRLFFQDLEMTAVSRNKNVYCELFINKKSCGYAIALNQSDQIKKLSHLFADAQRILFDEFQSETSHYCNDEINKFLSIHTSIARGGGQQVRYLPVYMLSNFVSLVNPYYLALNISHRIQSNTKFLRGDGVVLEQGFLASVAEQQKQSAFNRAFADSLYTKFASEKIYLNDNLTFVQKLKGRNVYLSTIRYNGKLFSLRLYTEERLLYCSKVVDKTFSPIISVRPSDHTEETRMISRTDAFVFQVRSFFERGQIRFQDLECKEVIFNLLSYSFD